MSGSDQLSALGRLSLRELGAAMGGIGSIHRAIAERVFTFTGPMAEPVRLAHHGISEGVYGALRRGSELGGRGVEALLRREGEGEPLSSHPAGAALLAVLGGLIGDRLEEEGSVLHEPMAVRVGGHAIELDPGSVGRAFPEASSRMCVFLHGLMETEHAWSLRAGEQGGTYATHLQRTLGLTPVFVRYNTGRHISENGASLAGLMEELCAAWPVPLESIALIGHSMGGLVARGACHHGGEWTSHVRHVISLGTPHMGAPLEQAVHVLSAGLGALPETRPVANLLRRRSSGIRDLRGGSLVDEDWRDRDREALRAAALAEVPLLDGAAHHFVSATITRSPRHPVGRLLGDWLVLSPSASGRSRSRRIGFREEDGFHLGGAHHLALLNHPLVRERLEGWLARMPSARPAVAAGG